MALYKPRALEKKKKLERLISSELLMFLLYSVRLLSCLLFVLCVTVR